MHLVVLLRLIPIKVRDHLLPLLMNEQLASLTLVRHAYAELDSPKVRQVNFTVPSPYAETTHVEPLKRLRNLILMFYYSFQTARRERPAAVYGIFMNTYGTFAFLIGKLLRRKVVISLIGADFNKEVMESWRRGGWRWMLRRTDIVTVFDEQARQKLLALGFLPQQVYVLPHAVDMQKYVRREDVSPEFDVIYVGNLWPLKQVGRLLEAWRLVLETHPRARLAVVGDGSDARCLHEHAHQLGISQNVTFVGWVEDVPLWLSRARIFASLSGHEGVPMSMLEAMACGLVPVVTGVGGVPSVVVDAHNGFLVDHPADPALVADRLRCLMDDDELYSRMQREALKVRENYNYAAVAAWWQPILDYLKHLNQR